MGIFTTKIRLLAVTGHPIIYVKYYKLQEFEIHNIHTFLRITSTSERLSFYIKLSEFKTSTFIK